MIKEFNNLEEIQKYYNNKTNTYVFKENNEYIKLVKFNFDLNIKDSHIEANDISAYDINSCNIKANNIKASDINVKDIKACNINVCDIHAENVDVLDITALVIDVCDIHAENIDALDIDALDIYALDIYAYNIVARNIKANDIKANNIDANNIEANNIIYYAVCFAYQNIKCKSIKGTRNNSKHFALDEDIEIKGEEENE